MNKSLENYECNGQLTINDYLRSLIADKKVMDLTEYINSQGKAQYTQVKDIIKQYVDDEDLLDSLTNRVSV